MNKNKVLLTLKISGPRFDVEKLWDEVNRIVDSKVVLRVTHEDMEDVENG